jgi:alkylation response protein AidB-like acyl-CoA dehydrogenase
MNSHSAVAAAVALQPLIREHLVEGEKRARLAQEVVKAVGEAGLFRLCAPQVVGGLEMSPPDLLTVFEAVSAADPAVGW